MAPDEPGAWAADLEYLFGPDLLVAPMTAPEGERHLYLPGGAEWIDYWTGEVHTGGRHLRVRKPLEQVPLFVRSGAIIATVLPALTTGEAPFSEVTVTCWGDAGGATIVHDVNGATRIRATHSPVGVEVTTEGPLRLERLVLAGTARRPERATVNGSPAVPDASGGFRIARR